MSQKILRSSHDWLIVALVAAAAFAYFTAGSTVLALLADAPASRTSAAIVIRIVLAIVIAAVMLVSEWRRATPSVDAAVLDGIQVAAVIIVANSLSGTTEMGARLALRSTLVLIGLPILAVLTHLLAQRVLARASRDSS